VSADPAECTALVAVVRGVVQGVGFRHSAQATASRLGLTGWVCNLRDGSVEAHLEGSPPAVAAMVEWLRLGPPGAAVAGVVTREVACEGYNRFQIRR
jgi:acylphosphatase